MKVKKSFTPSEQNVPLTEKGKQAIEVNKSRALEEIRRRVAAQNG